MHPYFGFCEARPVVLKLGGFGGIELLQVVDDQGYNNE